VGQVLVQLIPLALAAAVSTVPITAAIFILLSERRVVIAIPFLFGWVIGTAAGLTLATLAAHALPSRPKQLSSLIGRLEILLGIALLVVGLITLVRNQRVAPSERPGWIESIGSFGALPALGIGLALNLRPKALLLFTAASLAITGGHLDASETLLAIAVYTAVATSTVTAPALATVFFPDRMEPRLIAARDWITAHGSAVTGVVLVLVGVVVLVLGIV